jgi:hypothetical protein
MRSCRWVNWIWWGLRSCLGKKNRNLINTRMLQNIYHLLWILSKHLNKWTKNLIYSIKYQLPTNYQTKVKYLNLRKKQIPTLNFDISKINKLINLISTVIMRRWWWKHSRLLWIRLRLGMGGGGGNHSCQVIVKTPLLTWIPSQLSSQ